MSESDQGPIYTVCLVTFIDILGFRNLVENDLTGQVVLNTLQLLGHFASEDDEIRGLGGRSIRFSDSIVRITPLPGTWLDSRLVLRELEELAYIQGELMISGVLLRGGIAIGQACVRADLAFGPAFITAYTIESQHAVHPRIVLHPSIVDAYARMGDFGTAIYADDGLPLTRVESDGHHFLNYLRNFPRELHDEDWSESRDELYRGYAVGRKQVIERELARYSTESPIHAKLRWLARYHNETNREMLPAEYSALSVEC